MSDLSIKQKVYGIMGLLLLVVIASGMFILHSLSNGEKNAEITNVLGRQRMLTQAMGKSAMGYATSKGRIKTIENQITTLDRYVTKMRGTFAKMVIGPAKKVKLAISMDPASENHPAVPYPATFARIVNEKFGEGQDISLDIISESPVNPKKNLKTEMDKEANTFLKNNPGKPFVKTYEEDGKLITGIYTADKATVKVCASCHSTIMGRKFSVGDMLGIRNYKIVFSEDVALGKAELNASLNEYETGKKIFEQSLAAIKSGGEYPVDLAMKNYKKMEAVEDSSVQNKISEIEGNFRAFIGEISTLLNSEVGSLPYRKAQQNIVAGSNELRKLSNDLVNIYSDIAEQAQKNIRWSVILGSGLVLLISIGIGIFLSKVVIQPIQKISKVLEGTSEGDLNQERLMINSQDEMGTLARSCNQLVERLQGFIKRSEEILRGNTESGQHKMHGEFQSSLDRMMEQTEEKKESDRNMARIVSMVENIPMNMMYADQDFNIKYINPAGKKVLKSVEKLLPVKVDDAIGQSMDIFHKNPETVRKIVSDPANLPHHAQITVGEEIMELLISPIFDKDKNYLGPMVTWEVITEKIANEKRTQEMMEREREQTETLKHKVDNMLEVVETAAKGDLTREVNVNGNDAIGQMGTGLSKFLSDMRKSISAIGENAKELGGSSEGLMSVSQMMGANAEETSAQAGVVSAASEQVSRNVQTVATGAEEMNASINEIAKNASEASKVADAAVKAVQATNQTITKLGDSSNEIGQVIKVITTIAEQTNLLALNATIEAARAGEAGKGFAVVANEVKDLAAETAKATEEISSKIGAIQSDTQGAVETIQDVTMVIQQLNDISNSIASAVEEQSATTSEIGRNVTEAAKGVAEIAENITGVAKAADSTTIGATDTQKSASELSNMAGQLQELISQFKY